MQATPVEPVEQNAMPEDDKKDRETRIRDRSRTSAGGTFPGETGATSSQPLDRAQDPPEQKRDKRSIADANAVDRFLADVQARPPVEASDRPGRLIFALDATASRQPTWDRATALQGEMFSNAAGLAGLEVQLVYYRAHRECRASKWMSSSRRLVAAMERIDCRAGRTQIARVLEHGIAEARVAPVQALVFIGDCVEEPVDALGNLAGQAKLLGLPVFVFQEGFDWNATNAFQQIAELSGGAHHRFDEGSADALGRLLGAVAAYAAGGRKALAALTSSSREAAALLEQLG